MATLDSRGLFFCFLSPLKHLTNSALGALHLEARDLAALVGVSQVSSKVGLVTQISTVIYISPRDESTA